MTRHDPDLEAVRAALAERTTGTEPSVARAWHAVGTRLATARERAGAPARWRPPAARWWVPAAAAVTVAALAVGAAVLFSPADDARRFDPAAPPPVGEDPLPPPTLAPPLPPEAAPRVSPGLLADGTPVPVGDALAEIVASGRLVPPAEVAEGQLIYVRVVNWTHELTAAELHELWTDPRFPATVRHVINGRVVYDTPAGPLPADASDFYRLLTPRGLPELPSDPDALLEWLREQTSPGPQVTSGYVMKEVGQRLQVMDLILTPQLRVALYQALTRLDGVSAVELDDDGRRLLGLRRTQDGTDLVDEVLIDPLTGTVVGQRLLAASAGESWPEGVLSVQLWTQAVVDEVGQTG